MAFENRQEVAGKIDWEGGILSSLDYGLTDEDMPEGDTELREAWAELMAAFSYVRSARQRVEMLLPEPGEEEW